MQDRHHPVDIQKRLLKKTESGISGMTDLYHRESNELTMLFDFTDGSIRLEKYRDRCRTSE